MHKLTFPKWLTLLAEMAEKDRWISGSQQNIMNRVIFYELMPQLEKMEILRSRDSKDDGRVKEYALTIDGFIIASHIKKLYNRMRDLNA